MSTIDEAMAQALAAEESANGDWIKDERYSTKEYYSDTDVSIDIEQRTIGDISRNVSTVEESNAQYISFIMDRYIDGVDLKDMTIQIQAEASAGVGIITEPVNVYYNETHIRFGWSIPQDITQQAATIKIIVFCTGTLSDGNTYTIKTLPLSYEIKDTLVIGGFIPQPSENWYLQFVTTMNEKVTQATTAATTATQNAERVEANVLLAQESADIAIQKASDASIYANDANASANTANAHATTSDAKAKEASSFATLAESYAHGSTNVREDENIDNAKYYYKQTKQITQSFNGIVNMGTVSFEDLPTEAIRTNAMYNISTAFVSDERFRDGGGIFYGAGNNVVWTAEEKWDVLASSNVTGIKGSAEPEYRQGNVDITPANLGINIVNNTKDEDKNVNHSKTSDSATKATQDSDGNAIVDFYATKAESNSQRVSATAIGTNPTIQDSTNAPLIYGKFKGYTLQDGEPTPDNPVEINGLAKDGAIEVKTCGKNLLNHTATSQTVSGITFTVNNDRSITVNGTATADTQLSINTSLILPKGNYILNGCPANGSTSTYRMWANNTATGENHTDNGEGVSFSTVKETAFIIPIKIFNGATVSNLTFYPMIRKAEIEDATYEPYTETATAITTYAPLYEGDYIEIYADGSGKLVRDTAEVVIDGTTSLTDYQITSSGTFAVNKGILGINGIIANSTKLVCDYLIGDGSLSNLNSGKTGIVNYSDAFIYINLTGKATTKEEVKAWLQSNPMRVRYKLAEPTETPLTAEQVAQFKQLYTFEPVTNVFCDGEVELLYYKNTDNGETVGIVHKKVEKNERAVNSANDYYSSFKQTFDTVVGGKVSNNTSNVEYTKPSFSNGSIFKVVNKGVTLVNGLKDATAKIAETLSSMCDFFAKKSLYGDTTINIGRKAGSTVGKNSIALGFDSEAIGDYSYANGYASKALGAGSYAEGGRTISRGTYQHVQGRFNEEDTEEKYAHIVGNGTSDASRKNIHTLDWEGNAVFAGDVAAHDENGNEISLRKIAAGTIPKEKTSVIIAYNVSSIDIDIASFGLTIAFFDVDIFAGLWNVYSFFHSKISVWYYSDSKYDEILIFDKYNHESYHVSSTSMSNGILTVNFTNDMSYVRADVTASRGYNV